MGLATLLIWNIFLKANNSDLAYFNYSLKFLNYRNSEREDPKYLNLSTFSIYYSEIYIGYST